LNLQNNFFDTVKDESKLIVFLHTHRTRHLLAAEMMLPP
jgi:hypothetical protein